MFEKLDREYLDCVTEFISAKSDEANKKVRLVYQAKDANKPITFSIDNMIDPSEEWSKEHSYHLSWAVFKHLPSKMKKKPKMSIRNRFEQFLFLLHCNCSATSIQYAKLFR